MMTATRRRPSDTSDAPCRTIHWPESESTRANVISPGESASVAVLSARPATASTAAGSLPSAFRSPSGSSASQRSVPGVADSTFQSSVEDEQAGRLGALGVGCFGDEQPAAGAFGQLGGYLSQEFELIGIELRLAFRAVEGEGPPHLAGPRAQACDRLLVDAHGLHREAVSGAARRVAAGGFVKRRYPAFRACDIGELVEVVLVVFLREPFVRDLRKAFVVVAGGEQ